MKIPVTNRIFLGQQYSCISLNVIKKRMLTTLSLAMIILSAGCFNSSITPPQKYLSCNLTGKVPPKLVEIQQKLQQNQPKTARKLAERWIEKHPDSSYVDQALFLKAQGYMNNKLYYQAYETYESLLDQYSNSPLFAPALQRELEIARLFLAGAKRQVWHVFYLHARTEAVTILERIADRWPGSDLAAEAIMTEAAYYYKIHKYLEAQQTYELIVQNYKGNHYYAQAMKLSADATMAQYSGPLYDTVCLENARIRYLQYQRAFPKLAQKQNINEKLQLIEDYKAEKNYAIADFYRRTHEISAAKYYWQYVIKNWPNSKWAEKSQVLLRKYQ